ncbi:hypothetical protein B0H13DRAFT_1857108 [Mycena leptocephala]|nr:hypothetical protein B0H13DRAFT_1857108 [Mycena leptocephala]
MMVVCENCGHPNVHPRDSNTDSSLPFPSPRSTFSLPVQLRADLDNVEQAILRYQTYLAALETKQLELEMELGQIVYPVLTPPSEIIVRIFVQCLPSHGRMRPSPVTAPLLLAQICRHWRDIALSSCQLWNSVDVAFTLRSRRQRRPNDGELPLLETWFARAKGLPLSLTIRLKHRQIPQSLISFIHAVAPRLHCLELNLSSTDFQFLEQNIITFPLLRRLGTFVNGTSPVDYQPLSIFQHVPSLSELSTGFTPSPISNLSPSLTNIEMPVHHIPFAALMELFHHYPQLSHLTAHVTERSTPWDRLPAITAPHLRSLVLRGTSLDFLTLPRLIRLETDRRDRELLRFLERSPGVLEHLATEFEHFIDCLRTVPALTSLTVDVSRYMARFAEVFEDEPMFLPHLTTLRISGAEEDFVPIAFIQLLRDRCVPSAHRAQLTAAQLDLATILGLSFQAPYKGNVHSYVWPAASEAYFVEQDKIAPGIVISPTSDFSPFPFPAVRAESVIGSKGSK